MSLPPAIRLANLNAAAIAHCVDSNGQQSAEDAQKEAPLAIDLSTNARGWEWAKSTLARAVRFDCVQYLILSGSRLECSQLAEVLRKLPTLVRLDASRCGLSALPDLNAWSLMCRLKALFLHQNELRVWDDIALPLAAPSLIWFTAFGNPVAAQPEYRRYLLQWQPNLVLLDHWVFTDDVRLQWLCPYPEHVKAQARESGKIRKQKRPRRTAFVDSLMEALAQDPDASRERWPYRYVDKCRETEYASASYYREGGEQGASEVDLVEEMKAEFEKVVLLGQHCSAVLALQNLCRGKSGQGFFQALVVSRRRAALKIQKCTRAFLWKLSMKDYTRDFLAEVDQLDLMLSAEELLRRSANKRLVRWTRRWLHKGMLRRRHEQAVRLVQRILKGSIVRRRVLTSTFRLEEGYRRIYFPENFTWEFIVLLNIVHRKYGLPLLLNSHHFEDSDIIGLDFPDTDDGSQRSSLLAALLRISHSCLARPLRCGRFQNPWDGPPHRIIRNNSSVPAHMLLSVQKLRRRGTSCSNRWRQAFLSSCSPGAVHPINQCPDVRASPPSSVLSLASDPQFDSKCVSAVRGAAADVRSLRVGMLGRSESLTLKWLLEGPEEDWPDATNSTWGFVLKVFMNEARRIGPRLSLGNSPAKPLRAERGGSKGHCPPCYSEHCWTAQRLVFHECASASIALEMLRLLVDFSKVIAQPRGSTPTVRPRAFIPEYYLRRIAAATVIQSSYRAYLVRAKFGVGLVEALVRHRAVICIQRYWRWGLLKRRLEILSGAVKAAREVKSNTLYIEERTLTALSLINRTDRYPSVARERSFGIGIHLERGLLLVSRAIQSRLSSDDMTPVSPRWRLEGLPQWFWSAAEVRFPWEIVGGREVGMLPLVGGLQGLLLENCGTYAQLCSPPPQEDTSVSVSVGSLGHEAKLASRQSDVASPAIVASGGKFRFIELRYPSVGIARERALAFFLCTYNARRHLSIPLVSSESLRDPAVAYRLIRVWETYKLTWGCCERPPVHMRSLGTQVIIDCAGRSGPVAYADDLGATTASSARRSERARSVSDVPVRGELSRSNVDPFVSSVSRYNEFLQLRRQNEMAELLNAINAAGEKVPNPEGRRTLAMLANSTLNSIKTESVEGVEGEWEDREPPCIIGTIPPISSSRVAPVNESRFREKRQNIQEYITRREELEMERRRVLIDEARESKESARLVSHALLRNRIDNVPTRPPGQDGDNTDHSLSYFPSKSTHRARALWEGIADYASGSLSVHDEDMGLRPFDEESHFIANADPFPSANSIDSDNDDAEPALLKSTKDAAPADSRTRTRDSAEGRTLLQEKATRVKMEKEARIMQREARELSAGLMKQTGALRRAIERGFPGSPNAIQVRKVEAYEALEARRKEWQARSEALADRHMDCLRRRRVEVDGLKAHLLCLREDVLLKEAQELLALRLRNESQRAEHLKQQLVNLELKSQRDEQRVVKAIDKAWKEAANPSEETMFISSPPLPRSACCGELPPRPSALWPKCIKATLPEAPTEGPGALPLSPLKAVRSPARVSLPTPRRRPLAALGEGQPKNTALAEAWIARLGASAGAEGRPLPFVQSMPLSAR